MKRRTWGGAVLSTALGVCAELLPALLGHSAWRFATSAVPRSHYEEGPRPDLPFLVENKWHLLIMMAVYFGSGFAVPFFIVRQQLLTK